MGFGAQTIGHDPYRFFACYPADEVKDIFGQIWLRQLFREIAIAVFRDRTYWHWLRQNAPDRLTAKMHWLVHQGRILALWGSRRDYDHSVRSFGASRWIHISRPLSNFFSRHPETADATGASRTISPTVSVIICNYNYGRYLSSAIDSVLAQTWKKLDIIVVDDGSTDNSREILKIYAGRVRSVLKENGGQASAFNAGIRTAIGDIICFLDSDDLWRAEKVERVVKAYREFPWALICHDLSLVNEHGTKLLKTTIRFEEPRSPILGNSFDVVQKNGYRWIFRPTSALSIRADVAKAIVPIPEKDWRISADSPLAFLATCSGPVSFLSEALGSYRIHGENGYATSHLALSSEHTIRNLVRPVERYLLMKSRDTCRRQGDMVTPNAFYPEYRKRVFIAHPRPAAMIPNLISSSFSYYVRHGTGVVRPWVMFLRYSVVDIAVMLMISTRLPIRYMRLRREFEKLSQGLRPEVLQYLYNR